MMLNETYTKNIQPRDPERIRSDIETPCATVYNQGVTPVLYDNAVQASSRPGRAVEYLPENTIALSVSECVMMFLIQLVPVLGLIMAAVWSFSPNSGINKRTIPVLCSSCSASCLPLCASSGASTTAFMGNI